MVNDVMDALGPRLHGYISHIHAQTATYFMHTSDFHAPISNCTDLCESLQYQYKFAGNKHASLYSFISLYIYIHTYIYIHIYIYTYIHTSPKDRNQGVYKQIPVSPELDRARMFVARLLLDH